MVCCDPREEYHLTWDVADTTFSRAMPDELVVDLQLDPHSFNPQHLMRHSDVVDVTTLHLLFDSQDLLQKTNSRNVAGLVVFALKNGLSDVEA